MADNVIDPITDDPNWINGGDTENTVAMTIKELTNDENIELKTDVKDPLKLAMWDSIADRMKQQGLTSASRIMEAIREQLLVYEVSHGRKSRKEVIEALRSLHTYQEEEKSKLDRLMGRR